MVSSLEEFIDNQGESSPLLSVRRRPIIYVHERKYTLPIRLDVLDRGFVELIDVMPREDIDLAIVDAARASFDAMAYTKPERNKKLLSYLLGHKHTSPLEMVEFKFRIKAPVMVWWHLVRHRMAELNLQSGRYTPYLKDEFYVPSLWRRQSENNKQGSDGLIDDATGQEATIRFQRLIAYAMAEYEWALGAGIAKEQARLFLPAFAGYHTGIWKVNAHSLVNVIFRRNHEDAQWETQRYAECFNWFMRLCLPWSHVLIFPEQYPELA